MIPCPVGTREDFARAVADAVAAFPDNRLCRCIDRGEVKIGDYHAYLTMIFPQVFHTPAMLGMAASLCDGRNLAIRDEFLARASDERTHWERVLDDLRNTGYEGPDPRGCLPHPECQMSISFLAFLAAKVPVACLGVSATLEGIRAAHGIGYTRQLQSSLQLQPSQLTFLTAQAGKGARSKPDLIHLLDEAVVTDYEWAWLGQAARLAGRLYKGMCDAIGT